MSEKFELATTISGKTYKFHGNPSANLLIDLPNGIIIGITTSVSRIDCYLPDENETYGYAGDLVLRKRNGEYTLNFHSRAISAVSFNNTEVPIPKNNSNICDIGIALELDKSNMWFESIKKMF